MRRLLLCAAAMISAATVGCDRAPANDRAPTSQAPASGGVVDSALPIDTLLHRFRATLPDSPTVMKGGKATRTELVGALFAALQANDARAVRSLVITKSEFAWLYYPHTKWTKPPYEMGPDLVWLQVGANSDKGLTRLLQRYGGRRLVLESVTCPGAALNEGPNVVTEGCRVVFAVGDSTPRSMQLFGSLLNRDGRFKFVSYSNDL